MEVQSGVNLTSTIMSSQACDLETSGVTDRNAITNPPPMGGGSEARAQEFPRTSDVVTPDKGKGNQCLTTLPKEDWDTTLLENGKVCLVS